jgi:hypothetical protein
MPEQSMMTFPPEHRESAGPLLWIWLWLKRGVYGRTLTAAYRERLFPRFESRFFQLYFVVVGSKAQGGGRVT